MSYETEVVQSKGACCANSLTTDHFCGKGELVQKGLRSRCIICGESAYAELWKSYDDPPRIYIRKYCPEHGVTSARLSSDASFYFTSDGTQACGCGPGGCTPSPLGDNARAESQLHTCTLVVEIVQDCNLACPTCYADSPQRAGGTHGSNLSLQQFKERILRVLATQSTIDILQLSGGEPTLHPDLFELIEWANVQPGISQLLLNTNGLKLAQRNFAEHLAKVVPEGRFGVYLQYDGPEESGQTTLRGSDFRKIRERAIDNCRDLNIPVALVMTVTHDNKFDCGAMLARAVEDSAVSWIVYQPEFISGRNDPQKLLEVPINVADIIHSVAQSSIMDLSSWMPLPCSDPNCGTVGFLVRVQDAWHPVSKFVDLSQFTPLIANRVNYDVDDALAACGCDEYNLSEYLDKYGIKREDVKIVFIKPFMDVRTWDERRIASCCTHVLTPEGTIDSFCRYYGTKR